MERGRLTITFLVFFLISSGTLRAQILYHSPEIASGSFGMVLYQEPDGLWLDQSFEVYSLRSEQYRSTLEGKLWRPYPAMLPWLYLGLLPIPSTWVSGEMELKIGDDAAFIDVLNKDYIAETIPLTRTLTSIRTNRSNQRFAQSQKLSEILATFDPEAFVSRSVWEIPVKAEFRETSFFGDRRVYDYSDGTTARSIHNGHDYAVPRGTPAYAPCSGQVVLAEEWIVTGNTVIMAVAPGVYNLFYHLDELAVYQGQWLDVGDLIGTVGSTGLSTGPHLHWEVRINGIAVQGDEILQGQLLDKRPFITIIEEHFEKGR